MDDWKQAPDEVLRLAEELIDEHHPTLAGAGIGFVFRDKAPISAGKITLGQASKIPPKMLPFVALDFLIWLAEDFWIDATDLQRRALIDHELCHCRVIDGQNKIRPHDFEEFGEILERYGLWKSDLIAARNAFSTALQLPLPLEESIKHGKKLKEMGGRLVAVDPAAVRGTS